MKTRKLLAMALAMLLTVSLAAPALADDAAVDDGLATRGDVVKWLYSSYGADFPAENTEPAFLDVTEESGAVEAAAWAAGLGIAKGYGDGRFGPNDFVTREQAATMLYRFAQAAGQGFRGMWMFLLDYPDAAEISDWANEAMHWVVMKGVITERESALAPKDYIGINELPVWLRKLDDALATTLENDGYLLQIPVNFAAAINTELADDMPEGTLFAAAEIASIESAKKAYPDSYDGAGWLFAIRKVSHEEAHEMLCYDMSGRELFAKDGDGNHFLFCTPTDVRFFRDTAEEMMADAHVWTALNEWAAGVKDSFINLNGLTADAHGNTVVDIYLNQAAYLDGAKYTLSTTAFGPLEPLAGVDAAAYVERALKGVCFEFADAKEAPDGEYVVLKLDGGDRIDFFTGDGGNYVRRVVELGGGETFEELYKAVYEDGASCLHDVMQEWYNALAAAHGKTA